MKALIIDDSDEARGDLRSTIEGLHPECQVHEAKHGAEGLLKAGRLDPDIIFLDLVMPDMSGLQVLQILRAFNQRAYIAMASSQTLRSNVELALKLKANTFLLKPCDPEKVAEHLKKAFGLASRVARTRPPFEFVASD